MCGRFSNEKESWPFRLHAQETGTPWIMSRIIVLQISNSSVFLRRQDTGFSKLVSARKPLRIFNTQLLNILYLLFVDPTSTMSFPNGGKLPDDRLAVVFGNPKGMAP